MARSIGSFVAICVVLCAACKGGGGSPASTAAAGSGAGGLGAASGAGAAAGGAGTLSGPAGTTGGAAGSAAAGSAAAGSAAGSSAGGGATAGTAAVPSGPPTFSRVWTEVLMLKGCSGEYCHGAMTGNLGMHDKAQAYMNLVNVPAAGPMCGMSGKIRVKPFDPDASLLVDKISHPMPACGAPMPVGTKFAPNCLSNSPAVCNTDQEISLVRDWISAGAMDN